MESETRKELWAIIQAIGALYCCVIGTWALLKPPTVPTQTSPGVTPMTPATHIVWWFWILVAGFAICAVTLAIGTVFNFVSRKPSQLTDVTPQQRKPACERLQWANAERERLAKEVATLTNRCAELETQLSKKQTELKSIARFVSIKVAKLSVDEQTISRGKTLKIRFVIECSEDVSDEMVFPDKICLGASFRGVCNPSQDKAITLLQGSHEYDRDLTIPASAPLGKHMLNANVWQGVLGNGSKSKVIAGGTPVEIVVL